MVLISTVATKYSVVAEKLIQILPFSEAVELLYVKAWAEQDPSTKQEISCRFRAVSSNTELIIFILKS